MSCEVYSQLLQPISISPLLVHGLETALTTPYPSPETFFGTPNTVSPISQTPNSPSFNPFAFAAAKSRFGGSVISSEVRMNVPQ